jgi:folate-binding protein YgfZ
MLDDEYLALTQGAGIVDFSHRSRLEAAGDDRLSFLHKLSSNDVNGLPPGGGCEAFFLDARGHILGHAFLISTRHSIVIETVSGRNEALLAHLDRYLIREKVALHDRTNDWAELLVAGARSQEVLTSLAAGELPDRRLASAEVELAGQPTLLVRVEMTRPGGYLLFLRDRAAIPKMVERLQDAGAVLCGQDAFEAARIEAGFPLYGPDISDKNLPQEVSRNDLAISFRKGCYLGQETVARIDALGHVNKALVRLRFEGEAVPPAGTELIAGEVDVGQVTSAAFSPGAKTAVALAYVRRGSNEPGIKLASAFGPAVVERAS